MKMSFTFDGKALAATLLAMPKANARTAQIDALLEAAEPIRAVARRLAPRAPGAPDMAESIETMQTRRAKDVSSTEHGVIVGPMKWAFWGFFQEWGTVRHPAQPFLRPAFDQNVTRSLGILQRRLWENIQSWLQSRDV